MADGDGSPRQPPQAYDTVSPAGVGTTTTNQISPGTMQQLYFTGNEGLLDVAMEEMTPDALTAFLQSLPSQHSRGLAQFGWRVPCRGRESSVSHPVDRLRENTHTFPIAQHAEKTIHTKNLSRGGCGWWG